MTMIHYLIIIIYKGANRYQPNIQPSVGCGSPLSTRLKPSTTLHGQVRVRPTNPKARLFITDYKFQIEDIFFRANTENNKLVTPYSFPP